MKKLFAVLVLVTVAFGTGSVIGCSDDTPDPDVGPSTRPRLSVTADKAEAKADGQEKVSLTFTAKDGTTPAAEGSDLGRDRHRGPHGRPEDARHHRGGEPGEGAG